jgi:hypothetical protein
MQSRFLTVQKWPDFGEFLPFTSATPLIFVCRAIALQDYLYIWLHGEHIDQLFFLLRFIDFRHHKEPWRTIDTAWYAGKAAIHCGAVAGNIPMLKAILEFNPNLEIEVHTVHAL